LAAVAGLQELPSLVNNEASSWNIKEHRFAIAEFDLGLLPHLPAVSGVDAGEQLSVFEVVWLFWTAPIVNL
jgi:hypothetical protein